MRRDNADFHRKHLSGFSGELAHLLFEGPRAITWLEGESHRRYHRWFLRIVASSVETWRTTLIRPVVAHTIDRFAQDGRVELVHELSRRIPIRVIAAIMAMPWGDDAWVDRCNDLMYAKLDLVNSFGDDPTGEIAERAIAAANEYYAMFRPFVEERRGGEGDDLISRWWRDGPELLEDWSEDDVLAGVVSTFFAGADTTAQTISNLCRLLMTRPGLADELRAGGRGAVDRFVEEVLRLHGSTHFRNRVTHAETELCGARLGAREEVLALLAAANRDPAKYGGCPGEVDLGRKAPRDHLAFSFGPRTCVGAALARAELQEVCAAVLERLPGLRLDPDGAAPVMRGFMVRQYVPLHALFTPAP